MTGAPTPNEPIGDRELDRLLALVPSPPAPATDLTERIVARAAATAQLPALPPRRTPRPASRRRRGWRGAWAGVVLGNVLLIAAAAAAVLTGHVDLRRLAAIPAHLFTPHRAQHPRMAARPPAHVAPAIVAPAVVAPGPAAIAAPPMTAPRLAAAAPARPMAVRAAPPRPRRAALATARLRPAERLATKAAAHREHARLVERREREAPRVVPSPAREAPPAEARPALARSASPTAIAGQEDRARAGSVAPGGATAAGADPARADRDSRPATAAQGEPFRRRFGQGPFQGRFGGRGGNGPYARWLANHPGFANDPRVTGAASPAAGASEGKRAAGPNFPGRRGGKRRGRLR